MNDIEDLELARVIVRFASSTSKDGRESYGVTVLNGATKDEAEAVFQIAADLRKKALAELKPVDRTAEQLEASVASNGGKA